jgi:hypothetical protein
MVNTEQLLDLPRVTLRKLLEPDVVELLMIAGDRDDQGTGERGLDSGLRGRSGDLLRTRDVPAAVGDSP